MVDTPDPALAPRFTLRIGVTGHRPNKLDADQQALIANRAGVVLDCLSGIAQAVRSGDGEVFSEDAPDLRLVTSLAEGADTILAEAAQARGFRLDIILPFPRDVYARTQKFSHEARAVFDGFLSAPAVHSLLELDGDSRDTVAENVGYLAAGRQVLAHSDIMIAVWNGERPAGIGGTAQILREAVEQAVPVVWIMPDGRACLVTDSEHLTDFDAQAGIFATDGSCSDVLAQTVSDRIAPPRPGTQTRNRLTRFLSEKERTGSTWSVYDLMRRMLIGRRYRRRIAYAVDTDTAATWARFRSRAQEIGGPTFADALAAKLETRWRRADNVALHCSHAYRSTYVLNFILAGLAVLAGLLSVFWWSAEHSVLIKAGFVFVEVVLISLILWLTRLGGGRHEDWHKRWMEARTTAELLRSARLLALVGSTAAPPRRMQLSVEGDAWIEWYVRATLREIGPPTGILDAQALRTAIKSTIEDELDGQINYNRGAAKTYHDIDHKLHIWGERLFIATFVVGLTYIVLALLLEAGNALEIPKSLKNAGKALVTVLGAGLPAFGAALFGIRATGDFRVASEQAKRTLAELEDLKQRLETERTAPSRERTAQLLLTLTQALTSDLRDWAKIYRLRELQLPG